MATNIPTGPPPIPPWYDDGSRRLIADEYAQKLDRARRRRPVKRPPADTPKPGTSSFGAGAMRPPVGKPAAKTPRQITAQFSAEARRLTKETK